MEAPIKIRMDAASKAAVETADGKVCGLHHRFDGDAEYGILNTEYGILNTEF
ncbi:MAG: hypothetical protein ABR545_13240 [Cyclonatronaceae bacterium]